MKARYDVVIVGGAVIGLAVEYFLAVNPDFKGSATVNGGRLPLMIDLSSVFCRPEGRYFPVGSSCASGLAKRSGKPERRRFD